VSVCERFAHRGGVVGVERVIGHGRAAAASARQGPLVAGAAAAFRA
jgi:hypothetical protein